MNTRTSPRTSAATRRGFYRADTRGGSTATTRDPSCDDGRSSNDDANDGGGRRAYSNDDSGPTPAAASRAIGTTVTTRAVRRRRRRRRLFVGTTTTRATTRARGTTTRRATIPLSQPSTLGVVRQISAEDPFFGAPAPASSEPKNVEVIRAAEMDLDPSAIAASFGSPGDAADY